MAAAARGAQQVADRAGKPMVMVLQAFSWGPYYQPIAPRWPTVAEYTAMRDVMLANSAPRFVLWWAYYVIKREAEPERRWQELVSGAMAPWSGPPAAAAASSVRATSAAGQPAEPEILVRTLSATVRGRVAAVRFALSSPSRVRIALRCGGRPAASAGPAATRASAECASGFGAITAAAERQSRRWGEGHERCGRGRCPACSRPCGDDASASARCEPRRRHGKVARLPGADPEAGRSSRPTRPISH